MSTKKPHFISDENIAFIKKLVIVLLFVVASYLVYQVINIIVIFLFALFLNILFSPFLNSFNKRKIGDFLWIVIIYTFLIIFVGLVFLTIVPIFVKQVSLFIGNIGDFVSNTRLAYETSGVEWLWIPSVFHPLIRNLDLNQILDALNNNISQISSFFADNFKNVLSSWVGIISSITNSVFNFVLVFVFAFFIALERKEIRNFFYMILPHRTEKYFETKEKTVVKTLGSWLKGQLILWVSIFAITLVGLLSIKLFWVHIDEIFTLALIAWMMEFIPYIGPFIALLPAIAVAASLSGKAVLIIIILYVIIQQIENNLLVPYVMSKQLKLSPFLVLIGMVIWGALAWIIGIIVAIPIISIIQIFWNDYFDKK